MPILKKLFISHSHRDEPLATALKATLKGIFRHVQVAFSSDKETGAGVQGGENWVDWIHHQMLDCDESLLLLTPYSIQKPWPMWEAGAVSGIVMGSRKPDPIAERVVEKRVIPIRFGIPQEHLPGPFIVTQAVDGTIEENIRTRLLGHLMHRYDYADNPPDIIDDVLARRVPELMGKIRAWLANAPALVTEGNVVEWCSRIERLKSKGQSANVDHLHRWIRLMYEGPETHAEADARSWGGNGRDKPWDLRIHLRLGETYADGGKFKEAIRQYEIANELSPLDVFVLHGLALCQLEDKDREAARKTINRILKLDPDALKWNPEVAGLEGRYWKDEGKAAEEAGRPDQAREFFRKALTYYQAALEIDGKNTDFYMADNVGQLSLKIGDLDAARDAYKKARRALEGEREHVWSLATGATAALVLDDEEEALGKLRRIRELSPTDKERGSIVTGLALLRGALDTPEQNYLKWLAALGS